MPSPAPRLLLPDAVAVARYRGHCRLCDHPVRPGQRIARIPGTEGRRGEWLHCACLAVPRSLTLGGRPVEVIHLPGDRPPDAS